MLLPLNRNVYILSFIANFKMKRPNRTRHELAGLLFLGGSLSLGCSNGTDLSEIYRDGNWTTSSREIESFQKNYLMDGEIDLLDLESMAIETFSNHYGHLVFGEPYDSLRTIPNLDDITVFNMGPEIVEGNRKIHSITVEYEGERYIFSAVVEGDILREIGIGSEGR